LLTNPSDVTNATIHIVIIGEDIPLFYVTEW